MTTDKVLISHPLSLDAEKAFLAKRLKELERALEEAVKDTLQDVSATLDEQLFDKFEAAIQAATDSSSETSDKWGAKRPVGLYWATYKATVRRNGVYSGASGARDFNAELTEPMYKQLATVWEKAFQRRIPHILTAFRQSAVAVLRKFHAAVEQRSRERGTGLARIGMLGNQLNAYSAIIGDVVTASTTALNEGR